MKRFHFDRWESFLDAVGELTTSRIESMCEGTTGTGGLDTRGAIKTARAGWPEGTNKITALSDTIQTQLAPSVPMDELVYREEGFTFDTARVLEGIPECWAMWERSSMANRAGRNMSIHFSPSAYSGVRQSSMMARGAAIGATVFLLEQAGFGTEVVLDFPISHDCGETTAIHLTVTVKGYQDVLDLNRLAFAVAHPATLRRLCFTFSYGHGGTGSIKGRKVTDGDINTQRLNNDMSEQDAIRQVIENLETAGVELTTQEYHV